ncbi:hypothetical protein ABZ498_31995 [Streptomyces lavendulocolor]|uniref:hypothetical protein n=1 Tax=Streptomyces lavendulocolor TaxID=67316 RepID=UPI00340BB8E7
MSGYALPLLFTAAAGALTYLFCIRPMRRHGPCHMSPQQSAAAAPGRDAATDTAVDAEITRLREDVQLLRHELDLRSGRAARFQKGEPC